MSDVALVSVKVVQQGKSASQGQTREHRIDMDRPEAKGGENRGPMGGETFLMAFGGCFMSNLLAAAQSRKVDLSGVTLDITGSIQGTPSRFTAVQLKVSSDLGDQGTLKKLVTIAERGCLVANTLKPAIDLDIVIA
ncbi:MAG: OsmC family peroxiredoxin [Desulfobacteraceae bacterium]|nr:MAG: OsmC family peroxiredoxin [Desulfobacteraceae bacterium]